MKDPLLVTDVLTTEDYTKLAIAVSDPKRFEYQQGFSRYVVADNRLPLLAELAEKLVPVAREAFNSETLLPTYTLFAHYEGQDPAPSLYKHKDDNACTYTLDMCVYQTEPWDLWVDNKNYTLYPNQALAYYGNDQLHWREDFPNPESGYVAMVFFHFAEPDHWFFTKGPGYLQVIRGQMTEADWNATSSN
jgi:hypothetical protein